MTNKEIEDNQIELFHNFILNTNPNKSKLYHIMNGRKVDLEFINNQKRIEFIASLAIAFCFLRN